jgi:hypothetical protein
VDEMNAEVSMSAAVSVTMLVTVTAGSVPKSVVIAVGPD